MSSYAGTKFSPDYFDRKLRGSRVWPWILSFAVHGSLLWGMVYVNQGPNQQAGTAGASGGRSEGVTFVGRWDERAEDASPRVVSFTSATNRAPELLAPDRDMPTRHTMFDAHISLASALMPVHEAPPATMFDPHVTPAAAMMPVEPPQRSPIQATSTSANAAAMAAAGSHGAETQVFGVRSRGARFVYVFDRSSSMEGSLLSAAKRELIASLQALDGRHQFQIIFYNERPQLMPAAHGNSPRMAFADEPGKRLAANYIGGVFADGGTNHLLALDMALALKPEVIFFLTDAEEPQMWPEELAEVRRMNRGTRINTIEFGAGEKKPAVNFLQILAAENGGQHAYVDVRLLRVER